MADSIQQIADRLGRIDSFILCAQLSAKALHSHEAHAIAQVLLAAQNALHDARCALDPSLSDEDEVIAGGAK